MKGNLKMTPPPLLKQYSPWLETITEDARSTRLGRGSRLSIHKHINPELASTFGIVWDEDEDERIIFALETLFAARILPPGALLFAGERKGGISLVLSAEHCQVSKKTAAEIEALLGSAPDGDWFNVSFSYWPHVGSIVNADADLVRRWLCAAGIAWFDEPFFVNVEEATDDEDLSFESSDMDGV